VRKFGSAVIRTRSGDLFTLSVKTDEPSEGTSRGVPDFAAHWKRLREIGLLPPPASADQRIDRLIAGET
jgi:hypothetical protein